MENYTIAETYTLPSKGLVYDTQVDPNIKIRSMTVAEEMKRLSPSDFPYRNICEIIDDCIIGEPGISSYDMCLGDYLFLLHRLRVVTYGREYKMSTTCPYCGVNSILKLDLETLPVKEYDESVENLKNIILPLSNKNVKIKFQTPRMLDAINQQVKDFKKKNGSDESLVFTIESIIDTIDGKKPNIINLEQWIRTLPMAETNAILQTADKLNNSIGVDTKLELECETCLLPYSTTFKTTNEFFRPTLD